GRPSLAGRACRICVSWPMRRLQGLMQGYGYDTEPAMVLPRTARSGSEGSPCLLLPVRPDTSTDMNPSELFLLSPYRVPAQHSLALGNEDVAAFLNGYLALWHPTLVAGAASPPQIASAYDHENPTAGRVYATPESPPLLLPDDWERRVGEQHALAFRATPQRETTLDNLKTALRDCKDSGSNPVLLDLPVEQVAPFFGIGFGFLMINALFEAMEHENLL